LDVRTFRVKLFLEKLEEDARPIGVVHPGHRCKLGQRVDLVLSYLQRHDGVFFGLTEEATAKDGELDMWLIRGRLLRPDLIYDELKAYIDVESLKDEVEGGYLFGNFGRGPLTLTQKDLRGGTSYPPKNVCYVGVQLIFTLEYTHFWFFCQPYDTVDSDFFRVPFHEYRKTFYAHYFESQLSVHVFLIYLPSFVGRLQGYRWNQ
jgi:hypothetical protein